MKGTFQSALEKVGRTLDATVKQITATTSNGKKEFHRTLARFEQDFANPKTTLGRLRRTVDKIVDESKEYHAEILKRGGYKGKVGGIIESAATHVGRTIDKINDVANSYIVRLNVSLENRFYTNNVVDDTKVEAFVQEQKNTVKEYGSKFFTKIATAARGAHTAIVEDYRRNIPSQAELASKYSGVGTAYGGILTRSDYEGCLSFHSYAERTLPAGKMYRNHILADIDASASENLDELKAYYAGLGDDKGAACKLKLVSNYLGRSKKKKNA